MAGARYERIEPFLPGLVIATDEQRFPIMPSRETVQAAIDGGASMVLARDMVPPDLDPASKEFLLAAGSALALLHLLKRKALLFLRGGMSAAALAESLARDISGNVGVHVPERPARGFSLPPSVQALREIYPDLIISRSAHSLRAAQGAEQDGADMIVLGSIFDSKSHPDGPTIGVDTLREVCASVRIPVIAIGGITSDNARACIEAGAAGVAVIGAILDAPDARTAAAELRAAIGGT